MKIIIANTNVQALLKMTGAVLEKYPGDEIPENLKGQATLSALKQMFEGRYFDICKITELEKLCEIRIPSEVREYFSTLHCIHFENMTQETREFLFAKCVELFKGNIVMANSNV